MDEGRQLCRELGGTGGRLVQLDTVEKFKALTEHISTQGQGRLAGISRLPCLPTRIGVAT